MGLLRNVRERVNPNSFAFTLAEALITLGIIGVVAAITIPTLIQHHQQQVTANKLKKFHSLMNQAIRLSEVENGSCADWDNPASSSNTAVLNFYNTYLAKYIKSTEITTQDVLYTTPNSTRNLYLIKLSDGSSFVIEYNANIPNRPLLIYFYPQGNKFNSNKLSRDRFAFELYKSNCTMEPYAYTWNKDRNTLKTNSQYGCNDSSLKNFCAKLIEYDGWQISKDYPW